MCDQCESEAIIIGDKEVLPGWFLTQAQKDTDIIKKGEYGLVVTNSPSFIFATTPIIDPLDNLTDHQINTLAKNDPIWDLNNAWNKAARDFGNSISTNVDMMSVYNLVVAGMKVGYEPGVHGYNFEYWLFSYLGKFLRDNPIPEVAK